jgi:pilus assembly protein CpaB
MARRPGASGIILLAVVLGIVTAVLIWKYMQKEAARNKENWVPVVVAAQEIGPRTKITREMVRFESFPKELVAETALRRIEDAVDRTTQTQIASKEQVRSTSLLQPGEVDRVSLKVPEGMRAIAIGGDEVRFVGTSVKPGDYVDIIATYHDPRTKQDVTRIILQKLLVLAVNRGETETGPKGQGATSSMTLAVKPEETELLKAAERSGTMSVSLRSAKDQEIIQPSGITSRDLAAATGVPEEVFNPSAKGTTAADTSAGAPAATPIIFVNPQARPASKETEIKIYRATTESTSVVGK